VPPAPPNRPTRSTTPCSRSRKPSSRQAVEVEAAVAPPRSSEDDEVAEIVPDDEVAEIVADDDELEPLFAGEEIPVPDEIETIIVAADEAPADEVAVAEEPAVTLAPVEDAEPAPEPASSPRSLVILGAAEPWQTTGTQASFVPLGHEACEQVGGLGADACLVNLATPGALATAAALRAFGLSIPFWACAIPADGDRAWALGPFDVVIRPIGPRRCAGSWRRSHRPAASVIMVGSESATQIPLRQGLLQAGMSVRTAWDRKQACDLADAVQPDVVIVDLASEAAGGANLIVDLAGRPRPPLIVVVPGTAQQIEALETALAAHAATHGTTERATLLADAAAR
jgi:CheY-like chemotaxis protein